MEKERFSGLDNVSRAYIGLDKIMVGMYRKKDMGCLRIAASLLTYADIPAFIRARCHIVLASRRTAMTIQHCEAAIKLLDEDVRKLMSPKTFPADLLESVRGLLAAAQARASKSSSEPPSSPQQQVISEADEAALREAAMLVPEASTGPAKLPSSPKKHGLFTPGLSRTISEQDPPAQPALHQQLVTPKKDRQHKDREHMDGEEKMDTGSDESDL